MIEIIGVDMANDNAKDFSAVSFYCSNCKTVIGVKMYEPHNNEVDVTLYKKCPICDAKFKKYIVNS